MTPDCPNDCRAALAFPKPIENRASLRRIDYRIGTYSDFREALLRKLDQDPVLALWNYRGPDDPGIALVEAASILGDILTFYQNVYANELYLYTATLSQSIAGLVRLVGYRARCICVRGQRQQAGNDSEGLPPDGRPRRPA